MQPSWKFVANLGDVHPLDHGGLFIYRDETGVYPPEAEKVEPLEDDTFEIRRTPLDRYKRHKGQLVPFGYDATWPYPAGRYKPWFADDLEEIADCGGMEEEHIIEALCSDDPIRLAAAYRAIGDYHGWDNLDSYPLMLSHDEALKRYDEELKS
jgi:hypothetical protein